VTLRAEDLRARVQSGGYGVKASTPKRIQRKRTKGWRMPAGAIYVGRPTVYGNPYRVGPREATEGRHRAIHLYRWSLEVLRRDASATYAARMDHLRGHDLACWCPLDQPCHADVLLELANDTPRDTP
jgi:hypothetical protein